MEKTIINIDGIDYRLTPIIKKIPLTIAVNIKFEVHPDELGKMTWNKAIEAVKKLGDGWRLPSILECYLIYFTNTKNIKNEFNTTDYYWSSTEFDYNLAWYFYFNYGNANYNSKSNAFYVRAVRSI